MNRLNLMLNALVAGVICLAACLVSYRYYSAGTLQDISLPDDGWFRAIVLNCPKPIIVKFGAQWCGACRMLDPELDQLAASGRVAIVKIEVGKQPALAKHYRVSAIPHMFLFYKGSLVAQRVGYVDHERLRKWVEDHASR